MADGLFARGFEAIQSAMGVNPITFFAVFIIIFAVSYAILKKMEIFKSKSGGNAVPLIISLVFAFVVAISPEVSSIISFTLPGAGIIMIIVLVLLFTLALISPNTEKFTQNMPKLGIVLIILVVLIWLFISSAEVQEQSTGLLSSYDIGILTFTPKDISLVVIMFFVLSFIWIAWSAFKKKGGSPSA
ncbi:MAG: hypothetical protein PHW96_04085 [Candidatus Nanoarchaeia archaeon]|nr:hypothetical protein [Candidatus Nanoarchaeia archaeon]